MAIKSKKLNKEGNTIVGWEVGEEQDKVILAIQEHYEDIVEED